MPALLASIRGDTTSCLEVRKLSLMSLPQNMQQQVNSIGLVLIKY